MNTKKMNKSVTAYAGGTAWLLQLNAEDVVATAAPIARDKHKNYVWSFNFSDDTGPLVFYSPDIGEPSSLSPNDPVWDYVDSILEKIWANSNYVSPEEDAEWLREIRSGWSSHVEEMFDEFDSRE